MVEKESVMTDASITERLIDRRHSVCASKLNTVNPVRNECTAETVVPIFADSTDDPDARIPEPLHSDAGIDKPVNPLDTGSRI